MLEAFAVGSEGRVVATGWAALAMTTGAGGTVITPPKDPSGVGLQEDLFFSQTP